MMIASAIRRARNAVRKGAKDARCGQ